jgi:hypothetical protein
MIKKIIKINKKKISSSLKEREPLEELDKLNLGEKLAMKYLL